MAKKKSIDRKKLEKEMSSGSDEDQMKKMLKLLGIVFLFLIIVWLGYSLLSGELFGKQKQKEPVEIQNEIILAGSTFNRIEGEYYVLLYDFKGSNHSVCDVIYAIYNEKDLGKMFKVDLGDKMNSKVVTTDKNAVNTNSAADLKVLDGTLIKVNNGKAEKVVLGIEELNNYKDTLLNKN